MRGLAHLLRTALTSATASTGPSSLAASSAATTCFAAGAVAAAASCSPFTSTRRAYIKVPVVRNQVREIG